MYGFVETEKHLTVKEFVGGTQHFGHDFRTIAMEKVQKLEDLIADHGGGTAKAFGAGLIRTQLFLKLVFGTWKEQVVVQIELLHIFTLFHLVEMTERGVVNLLSYILV